MGLTQAEWLAKQSTIVFVTYGLFSPLLERGEYGIINLRDSLLGGACNRNTCHPARNDVLCMIPEKNQSTKDFYE